MIIQSHPKIKQILLHWDDELTKKDFFLMY